jgi:hypothetical protein
MIMAQTRNQASQRARQDANLNSLDSFGTQDVDFVTDALLEAVKAFTERVRRNIEGEEMMVTGEITHFEFETDKENGIVKILGNDYLLYQDQGVNGAVEKNYETPFEYTDKMPPIEPIRAWCVARGLPAGIEWQIQRKIFREGIVPTRVMTREIDQLVEDAAQLIADFTIDNITFNNL